ncbi:MAG: hypothetical protein M0036_22035 [Desulfobacteraceae bacterium]|nr:hypothetical protein [Desulfobacteraceae bacterium]
MLTRILGNDQIGDSDSVNAHFQAVALKINDLLPIDMHLHFADTAQQSNQFFLVADLQKRDELGQDQVIGHNKILIDKKIKLVGEGTGS